MADDTDDRDDPGAGDDRDDLEERLDRLEDALDALRDELAGDRRDGAGRRMPGRAAERALRLTERVAVPAAVAALEANVRVLAFVQERLRELEDREPAGGEVAGGAPRVSERVLDRLDDSLYRLEDAVADADLPRDAEARRLLERARELNEEVRGRVRASGTAPSGPTVVEIDVEEELEDVREDVADEGTEAGDDAADDGNET